MKKTPSRGGSGLKRVTGFRAEGLEPRVLFTSLLQAHYDLAGDNVNSTETLLTPSSVNTTSFGKQFSTPVDGQVYAQPLYVPNVNITSGSQQGAHNVVYVVTESDDLYAIDAHGGNVLWRTSFLDTTNSAVNLLGASSITTVPNSDVNSSDITPQIGATATPAISLTNNAIYIESKTKQFVPGNTSPHYVHTLYKVDIGSGAIVASTIIGDTIYSGGNYTYRVTNTGTGTDPYVNGTGNGAITSQGSTTWGGTSRVYFNSLRAMSRPGMVIANGNLYITYASHGDNGPYHGWVLRYDPGTLTLNGVLNTTPNGGLGGIWQGSGPAVFDASGAMYFETGNGTFDGSISGTTVSGLNAQGFPAKADYGDSFVKVINDTTHNSPTNQNANGWGLQISDYFSPSNNSSLNSADTDLGSAGPVVLPDAVGSTAHPHLIVGAGKEGKIYLIDRDNMGKFGTSDSVVQETGANQIGGALSSPGFFLNNPTGSPHPSGTLYYQSDYGGYLQSYTITNATLAFLADSPDYYNGSLDGSPTISANGTSTPIVWALYRSGNQLRAYNALSLATELWTTSSKAGGGDALSGNVTKFSSPTVADGLVMVGDDTFLNVYGPPVPPTSAPAAPGGVGATSTVYNTVNVTWQDLSNNEDSFYVERSTDQTNWTVVGTTAANATSYSDTAALANTTYYYRVRAHNTYQTNSYSAYALSPAVTTPNAPPIGTGDGAAAAYYNDTGGNHLVDPAALVRVDPQINNNYGNGGPGAPIGTDNFSARWTGRVQAQYSETYTFYTESDDGVRLYIKPTTSSTYTTLVNDWTDHGAAEDSGTFTLSAGQFYDFKMEYYEHTGGAEAELLWSSPSTPKGAIPQSQLYSGTAPAAPSTLAATPTSGTQLTLNWKDNSNIETGFVVQREVDGTNSWATIATLGPSVTTYNDSNLQPGTTYDYQVQATNFAANSAFSPAAVVMMPSIPATPTNAHPTNVSTTSLTAVWTDKATNASGYRVGVATPDSDFQYILINDANASSYTFDNLTPGTEYDVHISAYNIAGYNDFTGFTTTTVTLPPTSPVATAGDGQVTLNWTPPAYDAPNAAPLTYNVYRGTAPGAEGDIAGTGLTSPTLTDTGLTDGKTYYYVVTAVDPGGESLPSTEVAVTPLSVTVNDGSAQRSEVTSLTVKFPAPVTLQPGAVTVSQRTNLAGPGAGVVPVSLSNPSGDGMTYLVSFTGASGFALDYNSLPDGVYDLTVHASLVSAAGGSGSAAPLPADVLYTFHRLYGDNDGNKTVNALDYALFKNAFGSVTGSAGYNPALDFDGNGSINAFDYAQFKKRFGASVNY